MAQPLPLDPIALYRRLLEADARVELIDGEVVVHAAPGMLHGFGTSGLGSDLYQAYQRGRGGPGGWWILQEVDIEMERGVQAYRPDIAGWRRERVTVIPASRPVPIVPDFVCEVLSPSNARWERGAKRDGYARAGVLHYWLLDPESQVLEAFALSGGGYRLLGTVTRESPGALEPFPALRIDLKEIFPIAAQGR